MFEEIFLAIEVHLRLGRAPISPVSMPACACWELDTAASISALSTVSRGCPCRTKSPIFDEHGSHAAGNGQNNMRQAIGVRLDFSGRETLPTGTMDGSTGSVLICASCGESLRSLPVRIPPRARRWKQVRFC